MPVIMLTARTEERDRIAGLNAGADDYLPKPFGPDELLARIRAVLRRAGATEQGKTHTFEIDGLTLDERSREVWAGTEQIDVTSIEFDILDLLARSAGRIVSRDELTAVLHQRESNPYERSLDVHISHLRKKLERGDMTPIRTVPTASLVNHVVACLLQLYQPDHGVNVHFHSRQQIGIAPVIALCGGTA